MARLFDRTMNEVSISNGLASPLVVIGDRLRSIPLSAIALALAVQRLMLGELLKQDHRRQVRLDKTARRHVERCGG